MPASPDREAVREAECRALLNDPRLRTKPLRVVTVDYWFHAANVVTFWMWFLWVGFLGLTEPVAGLLCAPFAGWVGMRTYRYAREDWANIKRDILGGEG